VKPARNTFVVHEVANGWVVELNGSIERLTTPALRVYSTADGVARMLQAFANRSKAMEPLTPQELP